MINQQFEEWLREEIVYIVNGDGGIFVTDIFKLAHAIRNKVLHEAIEIADGEKNKCCYAPENIKQSLLNLLTKE